MEENNNNPIDMDYLSTIEQLEQLEKEIIEEKEKQTEVNESQVGNNVEDSANESLAVISDPELNLDNFDTYIDGLINLNLDAYTEFDPSLIETSYKEKIEKIKSDFALRNNSEINIFNTKLQEITADYPFLCNGDDEAKQKFITEKLQNRDLEAIQALKSVLITLEDQQKKLANTQKELELNMKAQIKEQEDLCKIEVAKRREEFKKNSLSNQKDEITSKIDNVITSLNAQISTLLEQQEQLNNERNDEFTKIEERNNDEAQNEIIDKMYDDDNVLDVPQLFATTEEYANEFEEFVKNGAKNGIDPKFSEFITNPEKFCIMTEREKITKWAKAKTVKEQKEYKQNFYDTKFNDLQQQLVSLQTAKKSVEDKKSKFLSKTVKQVNTTIEKETKEATKETTSQARRISNERFEKEPTTLFGKIRKKFRNWRKNRKLEKEAKKTAAFADNVMNNITKPATNLSDSLKDLVANDDEYTKANTLNTEKHIEYTQEGLNI